MSRLLVEGVGAAERQRSFVRGWLERHEPAYTQSVLAELPGERTSAAEMAFAVEDVVGRRGLGERTLLLELARYASGPVRARVCEQVVRRKLDPLTEAELEGGSALVASEPPPRWVWRAVGIAVGAVLLVALALLPLLWLWPIADASAEMAVAAKTASASANRLAAAQRGAARLQLRGSTLDAVARLGELRAALLQGGDTNPEMRRLALREYLILWRATKASLDDPTGTDPAWKALAAYYDHPDLRGIVLQADPEGERVSLVGENLDSADLSFATLADLDMVVRATRAGDVPTNLSHVVAENATLTNVRLDGARVVKAQFPGATFKNVRLAGADLEGASLAGATLSDVDLRCADLRGAVLTDATWTAVYDSPETRWDPGARPKGVIQRDARCRPNLDEGAGGACPKEPEAPCVPPPE